MSRRDGADASHTYLTEAEAAIRFPRLMIDAMAEDGRSRPVDAADPAAASQLATHWYLAPPAQFSRDYNRLKKAAKDVDQDHPIRKLAPIAQGIARKRGFHPWDGKPDPRCLQDFIPWKQDGLVRSTDPALEPPKGAIDVRPIVVDIEQLEYRPWFNLFRRSRQLDHTVLQAIERRLSAMTSFVNTTADLFSDITVAKYLCAPCPASQAPRCDGATTPSPEPEGLSRDPCARSGPTSRRMGGSICIATTRIMGGPQSIFSDS